MFLNLISKVPKSLKKVSLIKLKIAFLECIRAKLFQNDRQSKLDS